AREGVLLVRLGVEEDREVAADGNISGRAHRLDVGADDDPVAIADGASEKRIAHRTAHEKTSHRTSLGPHARGWRHPRLRDVGKGGSTLESASRAVAMA